MSVYSSVVDSVDSSVYSIVDSIDHLSLEDKVTIVDYKQRIVSENLGKNITFNHSKIYDVVEKRLGRSWKQDRGKARRGVGGSDP